MRTKELKVLMEGFNKFLINEHSHHSYNAKRLLDKIRDDFPEFEPHVNENMHWYPADEWLLELDGLTPAEEQSLKAFYQDIADECGCEVKDLLVSSTEDLYDDNNDVNLSLFDDPLLYSYVNESYINSNIGKKLDFNIDNCELDKYISDSDSDSDSDGDSISMIGDSEKDSDATFSQDGNTVTASNVHLGSSGSVAKFYKLIRA